MGKHTQLTTFVEQFVIERHGEEPKGFSQWQSHWTNSFSTIAARWSTTERFEMCGCESFGADGVCTKCNYMIRPYSRSMSQTVKLWRAMAAHLGHWWADLEVSPVSLTEIIYLNHATALWGNWGYNPPLVYKTTAFPSHPWEVESFGHQTQKQTFLVKEGTVEVVLRTTATNAEYARLAIYPQQDVWGKVEWGSHFWLLCDPQPRYRYLWVEKHLETLNRVLGEGNLVVRGSTGEVLSEDFSEWVTTLAE